MTILIWWLENLDFGAMAPPSWLAVLVPGPAMPSWLDKELAAPVELGSSLLPLSETLSVVALNILRLQEGVIFVEDSQEQQLKAVKAAGSRDVAGITVAGIQNEKAKEKERDEKKEMAGRASCLSSI